MEKCDILMVCVDSTAGVMNGLCEAINNHTPYTARFARVRDNWLHYPEDLSLKNDREEIAEILKDVQVIHWNIFDMKTYDKWFRFRNYDLMDKIHVRHYHGTTLRRSGNLEQSGIYHKVFVSTPDLLQYCKNINNAVWLPNPVYVPFTLDITYPEIMTILHNPTTGNTYGHYKEILQGLDHYPTDYPPDELVKGSGIFHKALWRLRREHEPITHVISEHVPWKESLEKKAKCSVYFDMLWAGIYGCSSIESMYLKKPVMCRISEDTEEKMKDLWLDEELPHINVGYKNLYDDIKKHIGMDVEAKGKESYEWVNKAHSPEKIAKRYVEEVFS